MSTSISGLLIGQFVRIARERRVALARGDANLAAVCEDALASIRGQLEAAGEIARLGG